MEFCKLLLFFFLLFQIICLPEVSITKEAKIDTNLNNIIGGYPNDNQRNQFVIGDSTGKLKLYKKGSSYSEINDQDTDITELRINLQDDYTIFGLSSEQKLISSYGFTNDEMKLLQEVQFDETPGCFHFLTTSKIIVALKNGQIMSIDWPSKSKENIAKYQFSDFENCYFRRLDEQELLLMHGNTISMVSLKSNSIQDIVENIYFSDVTTFGWLQTFALFDYNNKKLLIYNKQGQLQEESGTVSSNLGKDSILRRWSFKSDQGQNAFLVISSSKSSPAVYIYYYYDLKEITSYALQSSGQVSFLLPSSRGITDSTKQTEIHVGMSTGELYVLKFALNSNIIIGGDNDNDGDSGAFPWWGYVLIGIGVVTLIILQVKFGKKCKSGRSRGYNDSYGGNSGGFGGDCGGGGDGGGGDGGGGD